MNISDETKAALASEVKYITITFPNANITLTNEDIVSESLKLTEAIETENMLFFYGSKSSRFQIKTKRIIPDIRGEKIIVTIKGGEGGANVPLFAGYIDEQSNLNQEDVLTELSAYDPLYKVNNAAINEWYNNLVFPMTLLEFRTSFWNNFGLVEAPAELLFDSMQITKTISPSEISGRDVIIAICQLNAVFCRYNRDQKIEYITLSSDNPITIAKSQYLDVDYENFNVNKIGKVQIRTDEDDIGTIYGEGTNTYVIEDNFLVFDKSSDTLSSVASAIYNRVKDITYKPCEVTASGLPYIEPGDAITLSTNNNTIVSFVLSRTLTGIQNMRDTFIARGAKLRYSNINSVNKSIVQLKGKANRLTRNIEETQSKIDDVEAGLTSQITQTASAIELQINDIYKELDGSINVYNTNHVPTLDNYPAWDFTYNIPCNDTVQTTDTLQFIYNEDYYRKNARSIVYDLANSTTYRFKKLDNTWAWEEVADTEYALLMSRVTALEIKDGEITSDITSIYADVDELGTTTTTLSSKISQTDDKITSEVSRAKNAESSLSSSITITANNIRSEVSEGYATKSSLESTANSINAKIEGPDGLETQLTLKVDKDKLISEINASADVIRMTAGKMIFTSDNFTLDANGNITANNGVFNGQINASSGSIAGMTITSNALNVANKLTIMPNDTLPLRIGYDTALLAPSFSVNIDGSIMGKSLTTRSDILCQKLTAQNGVVVSNGITLNSGDLTTTYGTISSTYGTIKGSTVEAGSTLKVASASYSGVAITWKYVADLLGYVPVSTGYQTYTKILGGK